jgi:hypothetical protein
MTKEKKVRLALLAYAVSSATAMAYSGSPASPWLYTLSGVLFIAALLLMSMPPRSGGGSAA